jgi:hypothetical protein
VIETERVPTRPALNNKIWKHQSVSGLSEFESRSDTSPNLDPERHVSVTRVLGYRPTCDCNAGPSIPALVFDPFTGSGTTLQTARVLGRRWIGSELSEEYARQAEERIYKLPTWAQPKNNKKAFKPAVGQRQLFDGAQICAPAKPPVDS